jgi:hypothetical protein
MKILRIIRDRLEIDQRTAEALEKSILVRYVAD